MTANILALTAKILANSQLAAKTVSDCETAKSWVRLRKSFPTAKIVSDCENRSRRPKRIFAEKRAIGQGSAPGKAARQEKIMGAGDRRAAPACYDRSVVVEHLPVPTVWCMLRACWGMLRACWGVLEHAKDMLGACWERDGA